MLRQLLRFAQAPLGVYRDRIARVNQSDLWADFGLYGVMGKHIVCAPKHQSVQLAGLITP